MKVRGSSGPTRRFIGTFFVFLHVITHQERFLQRFHLHFLLLRDVAQEIHEIIIVFLQFQAEFRQILLNDPPFFIQNELFIHEKLLQNIIFRRAFVQIFVIYADFQVVRVGFLVDPIAGDSQQGFLPHKEKLQDS